VVRDFIVAIGRRDPGVACFGMTPDRWRGCDLRLLSRADHS
jgi:hypothetical protein